MNRYGPKDCLHPRGSTRACTFLVNLDWQSKQYPLSAPGAERVRVRWGIPERLPSPTSPLCISNVAEEVSSWWGMPHQLDGRPTDHPLMLFVWQRTIAWEPGQRPSRHSPEQLPGLAPEHARQGHTDYGTPPRFCRHRRIEGMARSLACAAEAVRARRQ